MTKPHGNDYWETSMPVEEFLAKAAAPLSEQVRAENLAQIAWFMAKYPSPFDRMRYSIIRCRQSMRFQRALQNNDE